MMEKNSPEIWDKFWQKKDINKVYPSSPSVLDTIKSHFHIPCLKVLEVGAGSGRDSLALAKEGASVSVLDFSQKSLEVIDKLQKQSGLSSIKLILADGFVKQKNWKAHLQRRLYH